jgi:agarase
LPESDAVEGGEMRKVWWIAVVVLGACGGSSAAPEDTGDGSGDTRTELWGDPDTNLQETTFPDAEVPDSADGEVEFGETITPADLADLSQEEVTDPCHGGEPFCVDTELRICVGGEDTVVLDCLPHGWHCLSGGCVAQEEETEPESMWRQRLVRLSLENAAESQVLDSYGGWVNAPESLGTPVAHAYFTVQKLDGRWWFVTPEGHVFLSKGVTDVNFLGANLAHDEHHALLVDKYGTEDVWAEASRQDLLRWSFNTVGPWSSASMAQRMSHATIILDSAGHAPRHPGFTVTDYWSEGFADHAAKVAQERAAPFAEDARLLGFFLDNELAWEANWHTAKSLLQNYMDFPPDAPGRARAVAFLKEMSDSVASFNTLWGTSIGEWSEVDTLTSSSLVPATVESLAATRAFAVEAFRQYASVAIPALKAVAPNHLVLGCRFYNAHWDELLIESGKWFDVVSLAYYESVPPVEDIDRVFPLADKPFLLEEFSFKANDSGYWNIMNYAPVVETQKERALGYHDYVQTWMSRPYAVAFHWYKWMDNPTKPDNILAGDNFGLRTPADEPYLPLVTLAAEVNRRVEFWHAGEAAD